MTLSMDQLLRCIGTALDAVETDLLGSSTNHGKRIATLCVAMGRHLGFGDADITAVATCALLHDNALTEYILSERPGRDQALNMRTHCILGQRNVQALPFQGDIEGLVLYHHERADGLGPFGKTEGEFPFGAALIAVADMVDAEAHLQWIAPEQLNGVRQDIAEKAGTQFTAAAAEALLAVLDEEMLKALRDENIYKTAAAAMPVWDIDMEDQAIIRLAAVAARIIDYKSEFTRAHSMQMANMAWWMSARYGFSDELRAQLYLTAALHDLGKLFVPTYILEKPGTLNRAELETIRVHAAHTHELLKGVRGLEDICRWAGNHHEKLNGRGYPLGKGTDELDMESRLIACLDIYQAVSDLRPYHHQRTHEKTIEMMRGMAAAEELDEAIVEDLNEELAELPIGRVPSPPGALI